MDLFYDAIALTYDQSPVVSEYFTMTAPGHPDNKRLWPLRYQAFKELGISRVLVKDYKEDLVMMWFD
jgi:hypothetical protein